MRKTITLLVVLGLIAGSCGGGGSDADSCEGIADQAMDLVQAFIDEVDVMTPEEVMAEEEPQFVIDMQADLDELEARSVEVGCSTETMQDLLAERAGDLTAESDIGQMMITVMQSEGIFEN